MMMGGTLPIFLALTLFMGGCSVRQYVINRLGNAVASGGTTYSSDDDPELVRAAAPFSLKLMESLLAQSPRHHRLLLAASSGFTQYAFAFVGQEADEVEGRDLTAANALRERARRLYFRARDYGLRGLEVRYPGFISALHNNPQIAVSHTTEADVPLLYWTAASWGAVVSLSKNNPDLIADVPVIEAMIDRALQLDEDFDYGAIHTFLITYEMSRQGGQGDPAARAREHFNRAMELTDGFQAAPLVALAEAVSVVRQDRAEFEALLGQALTIDINARPEWKLANLVMQSRARWLLKHTHELFAD